MAPLALLFLWCVAAANAADFDSYAFVNEDGTLQVDNATLHLYGILIPATDTTCYTFERPPLCGPRAILALQFDIGTDFVACDRRGRNPDGSYVASCVADGQDLSRLLLSQGWAVALPDAPFEYQVEERIARARGLGIWGMAVDHR